MLDVEPPCVARLYASQTECAPPLLTIAVPAWSGPNNERYLDGGLLSTYSRTQQGLRSLISLMLWRIPDAGVASRRARW